MLITAYVFDDNENHVPCFFEASSSRRVLSL